MKRHVGFDDEVHGASARKNRMGSVFKRLVQTRSSSKAESRDKKLSLPSLFRKNHFKRSRSEQSLSDLFEPEILKVSPMTNSCEVTLLSTSDDDKPYPTDHITVTTQDETCENDLSYHVVLNPRRSSHSYTFEDDLIKEEADFAFSSAGSTHALTTDFTSSAQSSTAEHQNNCEETIYFERGEEQFRRDRNDIMIRKESIFYKSLFDTFDESEEDADDQWGENSWREDRHSSYHKNDDIFDFDENPSALEELKKLQEGLNNTTSKDNEDDDDFTLDSREDGLPIEITISFR